MANIPYEARLVMLGMKSLETRRLKLDMQFAYKRLLFGIVDIETIQQCLASTLHREPEAIITNCMSREAGSSLENTSSVTELLNAGIIYQLSQSTSNPTTLFIPF
jgi:hypothetical protein